MCGSTIAFVRTVVREGGIRHLMPLFGGEIDHTIISGSRSAPPSTHGTAEGRHRRIKATTSVINPELTIDPGE
jgi:hypothetical protein